MKWWRIIKSRVYAVAVGTSFLFIGLQVVYFDFYKLTNDAIEALYEYDSDLEIYVLRLGAVMPQMNDLLQKAGIITWISIAFFIACIVPVFFILRDYYEIKSIRTIMRLPISKTYYFIDKLLPSVLMLGFFWLLQWNTVVQAGHLYVSEVPAEKIPPDVWKTLWTHPPLRLFYPFAELSRMPAALSFLILVPATVVLFVFAERSKKRGILSGVIACIGIIAVVIYLLDLPASLWLVPAITAGVLTAGVWHINRIQIT